jgi:hypothetical protein
VCREAGPQGGTPALSDAKRGSKTNFVDRRRRVKEAFRLDLHAQLDKNAGLIPAPIRERAAFRAPARRRFSLYGRAPSVFDQIEKLKQEYTDKYVVVDASVPELKRFDGHVGVVKTVNMSGRALVEFDAWNNIGWYDIEPKSLKVVPKPEPAAEGKKQEAKPAAKKEAAAKPAAPAAAEGKKLSPLEMARMQGAAKGTAGKRARRQAVDGRHSCRRPRRQGRGASRGRGQAGARRAKASFRRQDGRGQDEHSRYPGRGSRQEGSAGRGRARARRSERICGQR